MVCYDMYMHKYQTVEEFLDDLDDTKLVQVNMLRGLIKDVAPQLEEHIKWNAPSYIFDGEDRITLNLLNKQEVVKLVFHMGATRKEDKKGIPVMHDESGLVEWSSDIRGTISFSSIDAINKNTDNLKTIIEKWLATPVSI